MQNTISLDQLRSQLPQAFVSAPSSRVSDKYTFIPTSQILADLDKLGWKVREVTNPRYKSEGKQLHGRHCVRLMNPNITISKGDDVNNVEIALYNSSDGTSKFRMEVGIIRWMCENGLVVKSQDFGSINMRHTGYSFEALKEAIDKMIQELPKLAHTVNKFSAKELTQEEMTNLAKAAFDLRGGGKVPSATELEEILKPRRDGDVGNDLWKIFNRVQESVVRGGQLFVDARGRMRTQKPIRNIDKSLKLNQELWSLAESYC